MSSYIMHAVYRDPFSLTVSVTQHLYTIQTPLKLQNAGLHTGQL